MGLSFEQLEIINGSLLGDAHLSPIRTKNGNSSFVKRQKVDRLEYLEWHFAKMEKFSSSIKKYTAKGENLPIKRPGEIYSGWTYSTKFDSLFKELRLKWYPHNKKIVPKDLKLTPQTIAMLFADDGQNVKKQGQAIFHTQGFSLEDRNFLIEEMKKFRIFLFTNDTKRIYVKSSSYIKFIDLISPYMVWDCFKYKIDTSFYKPKYNKLSSEIAIEIFDMYYQSNMTQKEIAFHFNIDSSCVSDILRGKSYPEIGLSKVCKGTRINGYFGKGVGFDKTRNKWIARLGKKNLGRFNTEEEALETRRKAVEASLQSNATVV